MIALCIDENETVKHKSRNKIWKCQCDCGKITYVASGNLCAGNTISCGCYKEDLKKERFIDLTGRKFNKLTVLRLGEDYIEKNHIKRRTWDCLCDCGNIKKNILEKSLKSGLVKSCGCLLVEVSRNNGKKSKKYNRYNLSKEYGIGYSSNNKEFYFDLEDYEKISGINWIVKSNNYVEGKDENQKTISLHRLVMGYPKYQIDHINHHPNDNRKINLRIVDRCQNQANTKIRVDNTSGTKGVYYCSNRNNWVAQMQVNHKQFTKHFRKKEDAIKYRKLLEEKHQKEYSYDNSIKSMKEDNLN